jgi:protein-tyrosine phosphatase
VEPALDPPLRVDWLEADELGDGLTGRLGLTFLPGKRGVSLRYPGLIYRRRLADDLATLRRQGIRTLVLLVEDNELDRWGDADIVERAAEAQIGVARHPIPDGSPPGSLEEMDAILASVSSGRREADVAVACMGGVGRTGTVAACALVAAGRTAHASIRRIRELRHPTAVETRAQEAFVGGYERHIAEARRASGKVAP